MKQITPFIFAAVIAAGLIAFFVGWDAHNTLKTKDRDFRFYVDPGTGCEYVIAPQGAVTPRLTTKGVQVCNSLLTSKGFSK